MIEIKNLKKIWEDDKSSVLEDINLTIEDGDIYALVGRSGAGKSTLLRCINGLTSYQGGSLTVDGCEIKDLKDKELREFRRRVGMIFQHFPFWRGRRCIRILRFPCSVGNIQRKRRTRR